ncbi:MAG: NADH-quinone oxidoreductase subunit A [bacterium]
MLSDLAIVFMFVAFGLVFVVINILLGRLLTWMFNIGKDDPRKHSSYECGESPIGDARVRFNPRFYLIALVFLIFDLEAIFLLPIAVIFKGNAAVAFAEVGIFLGILLIGLAYVWYNQDLDWVKPQPRFQKQGEAS